MKYYILSVVCLVVEKNVQAQYENEAVNYEEPAPEGENPYYDQQGAPQPPPHQGEHHEPPPQQGQNDNYQNQPPRQNRFQGARFANQGLERTTKATTPFVNESFTLPSFYESISTTIRTVKVNRRTYQQLIEILIKDGVIKTPRVIEAFSKIDRGYFVHPMEDEPYGFMVRKLGRGVFLEKPHFQGKMVELLAPAIKEGSKVLDIGSGTGFLSCIFAELAGKTGKVYALEHIKETNEDAWDIINQIRPDLINDGRLHLRSRDGRAGLVTQAPFDAIFVSPYLPDIPNNILIQLAPGGRLICGIGRSKIYHKVVVVDRSEDGKTFHKYDAGMENFINPMINYIDQNDNWLYQQSRRRIIEAKNQGFTGIQLARKLKMFTKKSVDYRKLEDDTYKFIEFK